MAKPNNKKYKKASQTLKTPPHSKEKESCDFLDKFAKLLAVEQSMVKTDYLKWKINAIKVGIICSIITTLIAIISFAYPFVERLINIL
ncbi:MAG: hypothetical protein FWG64_02050 [Firmicutes bacterium]|nr:hypothetical protein [Bacillota bacterium]